MTWTVTALGTAGTSTTATTPVSSLTSGTISISVGDGIAVFCQYTDFQADTLAITDSSGLNTWVANVDNPVDAGTGEGLASFYCLSAAHTATTITVSFGSAVIQSFGMIKFTNTVSGTPTLDGHHGLDNSTATTTPNSGAGTGSNNGDLVLAAMIGDTATAFGSPSLGMTGVTTPTIRNNVTTSPVYLDGSGVTTTTGSVTSTFTISASRVAVVLEMIFKPPSSDVLMAQACM